MQAVLAQCLVSEKRIALFLAENEHALSPGCSREAASVSGKMFHSYIAYSCRRLIDLSLIQAVAAWSRSTKRPSATPPPRCENYEVCIKNEEFCIKITQKQGILFQNHTKMRNYVLKMINFADGAPCCAPRHRLFSEARAALRGAGRSWLREDQSAQRDSRGAGNGGRQHEAARHRGGVRAAALDPGRLGGE